MEDHTPERKTATGLNRGAQEEEDDERIMREDDQDRSEDAGEEDQM